MFKKNIKDLIDSKLITKSVENKSITVDELEEVMDIHDAQKLKSWKDGCVVGCVTSLAVVGLACLAFKIVND